MLRIEKPPFMEYVLLTEALTLLSWHYLDYPFNG